MYSIEHCIIAPSPQLILHTHQMWWSVKLVQLNILGVGDQLSWLVQHFLWIPELDLSQFALNWHCIEWKLCCIALIENYVVSEYSDKITWKKKDDISWFLCKSNFRWNCWKHSIASTLIPQCYIRTLDGMGWDRLVGTVVATAQKIIHKCPPT